MKTAAFPATMLSHGQSMAWAGYGLQAWALAGQSGPMSVFLSLLSALLYGCGDFMGGFCSRRERVLPVMAISQAAGLVLAFALLPIIGFSAPSGPSLLIGALGGLGGALGLYALYRGISKTIVAIVSPSSALVSALLPLAYGALRGERPSAIALVGALVCLPAVILLSWGGLGHRLGAREARSALLHGVLAGIGFGFFFIAISETDGFLPLVAARSTSICCFLAAAAIRRERLRVTKASLAMVLAAGLADMGANVAFLLASRAGLLMLASAVSSLYPAPTVVLARCFMGQRLGWQRLAGLALAIAGTALIALG